MIRGKVLGGSSGINGMMWTSMRGTIGHDGDDDALEELSNPGWNFASLQGYYCSSSSGCLVTRILALLLLCSLVIALSRRIMTHIPSAKC